MHSWPPHETNRLIRLWGKKITANKIAEQLSEKSRNAVLSKAKRLGLRDASFIVVSHVNRIGQAKFRSEVLSAYENKCCVTGNAQTEILEAAHIIPFSETADNSVNKKGRPDVHRCATNSDCKISQCTSAEKCQRRNGQI